MGALYETDDDANGAPEWLRSTTSAPLFDSLRLRSVTDTPTGFEPPAADDPGPASGQGGTSVNVAASGNARIDGLLIGTRWSNSDITYSDPDAAGDYQSGYNVDNNENGISAQNEGFGRISSNQLYTVHYALNTATYTQPAGARGYSVEGFTNASLTYNGAGAGNSVLRYANTSDNSTGLGYYPANTIRGGDGWLGTSIQTPTQGNYEWNNTLHEIGHTLGLKHGHETGGPGNTALPTDYDSLEFSVMTYRSYIGGPTSGYTNGAWDYPQTYMMLDIAALQYMYGADFSTNGGNTTYTWSQANGQSFVNGTLATNPGGNRVFMTIWDGGGIDTYNLSNYTSDLEIDLAPGGHSDFNSGQSANLGGGPNGGFARGNVFNALLYQGDTRSLIENAIGGSGDDSIGGNQADNGLLGNGGDDRLSGLEGNDSIEGGNGDDDLKGGGGTDLLAGGNDNDSLKGGGEADILIGGTGIDSASYADSGAAVDVALDGSGFGGTAAGDTLFEIENLYGSRFNDTLRGNDLDNNLDGGDGGLGGGSGGVDTMIGFGGNDTYHVDEAGDVVVETSGNDTVLTSVSYALAAGLSVETLAVEFSGSTGAIDLTGNEFAQTLRGNAGANTLDGRGEADDLYGLAGDDIYVIDNAGDRVFEAIGEGNDRINARASFVLQAGQSVELLTLSPAAGLLAFNLTGNELDQTLLGNDGANTLDGGGGADTLRGNDGNDIYFVGTIADQVFEANGQGTDTVLTTVSYTLAAGQSIETLRLGPAASTAALNLNGNEFAQTLLGNAGANTLDGRGGADILRGFGGNDVYVVDTIADQVFEANGQGTDTVLTTVSYTLAAGQAVETLRLGPTASTAALNLNGNEFAQTLLGNNGANTLDGRGGADTLRGFGGNDAYFVDTAGDLVFEANGQGTDTVLTTVSYTLTAGQSIETLRLGPAASTAALNLNGNEFAQTLLGNNGANILDGRGGADTLRGFGGNDSYVVDTNADQVFEANGQGTDTVLATVSYTLAAGQSVETLRLAPQGSTAALNLTGNALAQTLLGNNGNNILDGGAGNDILGGLAGNDSFQFSTALGAGNIDRIADFSVPNDTIRLDRTIFSTLALGTLSANAYKDIGDPGAVVDADDRILYNDDTGQLFYDTNGSAAGGRLQFAILDTKPATLTNADFFVVA